MHAQDTAEWLRKEASANKDDYDGCSLGSAAVLVAASRLERFVATGAQTEAAVDGAAGRMKLWANGNPWADTQGITDDEWRGLALAALGTVVIPDPDPQ